MNLLSQVLGGKRYRGRLEPFDAREGDKVDVRTLSGFKRAGFAKPMSTTNCSKTRSASSARTRKRIA